MVSSLCLLLCSNHWVSECVKHWLYLCLSNRSGHGSIVLLHCFLKPFESLIEVLTGNSNRFFKTLNSTCSITEFSTHIVFFNRKRFLGQRHLKTCISSEGRQRWEHFADRHLFSTSGWRIGSISLKSESCLSINLFFDESFEEIKCSVKLWPNLLIE